MQTVCVLAVKRPILSLFPNSERSAPLLVLPNSLLEKNCGGGAGNGEPGDQIGQNFIIWATFETPNRFFGGGGILAQKSIGILGNFFLEQIFYIISLISSLKPLFVVGILRLSKWFDSDVLSFQIELWLRLFGLATTRLLFLTFGRIFSPLFCSP